MVGTYDVLEAARAVRAVEIGRSVARGCLPGGGGLREDERCGRGRALAVRPARRLSEP